MFDPRTLPNGDFWPSVGVVVLFVSLLLDVLVEYYGRSQYNPAKATKTIWFGAQTTTFAFVNSMVRLGLTFVLAAFVLPSLGLMNNAHAYVPFLLAAPGFANTIRNLLIIKK